MHGSTGVTVPKQSCTNAEKNGSQDTQSASPKWGICLSGDGDTLGHAGATFLSPPAAMKVFSSSRELKRNLPAGVSASIEPSEYMM